MKILSLLEASGGDPFDEYTPQTDEEKLDLLTQHLYSLNRRLVKIRNKFGTLIYGSTNPEEKGVPRSIPATGSQYYYPIVCLYSEASVRDRRNKIGINKCANRFVLIQKTPTNQHVYDKYVKLSKLGMQAEELVKRLKGQIERLEVKIAKKNRDFLPKYSASGKFRKKITGHL